MSLKIYFCGSIRAGREDAPLYAKIIAHLQQNYGQVLTEHVAIPDVIEREMAQGNSEKYIHDRDIEWLKETDVIVAEVTKPSLGVGYEIGRAVALNKPILCMYRPQPDTKLSAMIQGAHNGDSFMVVHYKEEEALDVVDQYFKNLKK